MIKTRHAQWAHFIFAIYIRRLLRRNFHSLNLLGDIPIIEADQPILLLSNHSSWWDGFLVYFLNEKLLHRPLYLMMLESELKKYPFFSRVGAFSIDPGHPKSVLTSLEYSHSILELPISPAPLLALFPQGELRPNMIRPLGFAKGHEWIIKKSKKQLAILTLGIRIEFLDQQLPEVFFQFGKGENSDFKKPANIELLENSLTSLLDSIQSHILAGSKGKSLLKGSSSVNEKWDSFRKTFRQKTGK
jgi:hypothetical protein